MCTERCEIPTSIEGVQTLEQPTSNAVPSTRMQQHAIQQMGRLMDTQVSVDPCGDAVLDTGACSELMGEGQTGNIATAAPLYASASSGMSVHSSSLRTGSSVSAGQQPEPMQQAKPPAAPPVPAPQSKLGRPTDGVPAVAAAPIAAGLNLTNVVARRFALEVSSTLPKKSSEQVGGSRLRPGAVGSALPVPRGGTGSAARAVSGPDGEDSPVCSRPLCPAIPPTLILKTVASEHVHAYLHTPLLVIAPGPKPQHRWPGSCFLA